METYYSKNKKRILQLRKERYTTNKEVELQRSKANYDKNKNRYKKQQLEYRQETCVLIKQRQKKYWSISENKKRRNKLVKHRRATDLQFKLKAILRTRLSNALRSSTKKGSAVRDLGCSVDALRIYLESKFKKGMSWANHGEWHIDHIKPLSIFDLTNRNQVKEACHYTNLQPLWAFDNLSKGNTYEQ